MKKISTKLNQIFLATIISLSSIGGGQTFEQNPTMASPSPVQTISFIPPNGSPAPKRTSGAATRGSCGGDPALANLGMVAILPKTQHGLTVSSRPELLAYIPKTTSKQIFFSIKSEDNTQVYQTLMPLTKSNTIVSIKLPNDAPELVVGKNYVWSIAMLCSKTLRPDSPIVEGWVQRVAKAQNLSKQLEKSNDIEKIALYGQSGLWYDMISKMYRYNTNPANNFSLKSAWENLLTQNGLPQVVATTRG